MAAEAQGRASGTIAGYRGKRDLIALSPIARRPVSDLTPGDLESFMGWRREHIFRAETPKGGRRTDKRILVRRKGAAPSNATICRDISIISAALNRLVRLDVIDSNPATRIRKPRERRRTRVFLAKDEIRDLINSCDDWCARSSSPPL